MPQDMKKSQTYAGKQILFENEEVTEIKRFDSSGSSVISCKLHIVFCNSEIHAHSIILRNQRTKSLNLAVNTLFPSKSSNKATLSDFTVMLSSCANHKYDKIIWDYVEF